MCDKGVIHYRYKGVLIMDKGVIRDVIMDKGGIRVSSLWIRV